MITCLSWWDGYILCVKLGDDLMYKMLPNLDAKVSLDTKLLHEDKSILRMTRAIDGPIEVLDTIGSPGTSIRDYLRTMHTAIGLCIKGGRVTYRSDRRTHSFSVADYSLNKQTTLNEALKGLHLLLAPFDMDFQVEISNNFESTIDNLLEMK